SLTASSAPASRSLPTRRRSRFSASRALARSSREGEAAGGVLMGVSWPGWGQPTHSSRLLASPCPGLALGPRLGANQVLTVGAPDDPGAAGAGFADGPTGAVEAIEGLVGGHCRSPSTDAPQDRRWRAAFEVGVGNLCTTHHPFGRRGSAWSGGRRACRVGCWVVPSVTKKGGAGCVPGRGQDEHECPAAVPR